MRKINLDELEFLREKLRADYILEHKGIVVVVEEVKGKAKTHDIKQLRATIETLLSDPRIRREIQKTIGTNMKVVCGILHFHKGIDPMQLRIFLSQQLQLIRRNVRTNKANCNQQLQSEIKKIMEEAKP